jgi:hypothetical protein
MPKLAKPTMTNLPVAIAVGGGIGLTIAVVESLLFGMAVELDSLLKYGGALAGLLWLAGREFQKVKSGQDDLRKAIGELHANQEAAHETATQLVKAVREIQTICTNCLPPKKKTELVVVDTPHRLP